MALKDCKFFADINGRQVEMDFDGFRAYLLEDGVMATLAPEITGKRGKKAGFILTAKKEEPAKTATTKAEAPTVKAQAPAENVVTVTAEPTDAHIIANSVKIQKVDAQGFTKRQREYLVEKAKEVYKEAQEASESTKFVIKVPGDGQFTVKTPTEANSLHRRLTGDNVPGVDAKDTKVKREVLNPNKKTGLVETVAIGKAGDMKTPAFRWALQATAPSPATSKPLPSSLFGGVNKKGEFENKGSGVYPFEMHGSSKTLENVMSGGEYITDAKVLVLRSASTPEALKKVKTDSSRTRSPNIEDVKSAWEKAVNDATVPAEIAGVFQSETVWGVALIEAPKGIIPLDANRVKTVFDLVKPDGVMIAPDDLGKPVIFTKNGKPVGTIMPLLGQSGILKKDELANALDEMKRQSGSPSTLPVSAESLRRLMPSLSKDRAETLIKLLKAMGLPFDRIKLAKGEAGPSAGLKQAETSASVREAAKKWAGVKEIKPAVNSRLSSLINELEQLRGSIERSLYKKSIDELIAIDPMMQMTFGGYRDKYPVQQHSRLKTTIVEYYSNLFNQPESDYAYDYYSEQWGVPKADLIRQADINTLINFKDDSAIDDSAFKEEAEERLGISKESILERGRETFKTGQPVLVEVYHGTGAAGIQGNRFNASLAGKATGAESARRGYFFAGSKSTAERYRSTSALDPENYTSDTKGILYKFFVKMKNPFVYDMKGNLYREDTYANIMGKAKAAGHDGVIFTNTYDGGALDNIFTLFHSHENQIKSANPNTYDDQGKLISKSERFQAETPDIRYQKGQKPKQPTAITGMTPQEAVEYFKKAKLVRPELAQEILTKDVPEHLQPVADFIFRQRQKFLDGKMTVRDVAKAYIITVSSIQAGAIGVDAIKASTGQTFPEYATMRGKTGDIQIRPEDAVSAWLLTPDGKKALDSLEQTAKVDEKLWQPLIDLRQAYGNNTLKTWAFSPKSKGVNLYKIEEMARLINQTGGNPRKLEAAVQRLVGIKDAKAGFIKHLLGFGDTPTVDAREINFWLTGSADISSLKTKGAEVARAAKDAGGKVRQYVVKRIGNQIKDLAKRYDMDVNVGAHIVHHWLWDATSNEVTTHAVMMDAMELAQQAYHATRGLFAPEPGFPNGRFRLDKVDTGLGAQSFGHGIYIAESRAGVVNYVEMLEEEAPGSVVYELDVPDGIVSKLATYEKPLTPSQFAALKNQVQSTLGEKALQAIPGRDKTDAGDLIERIQDVIKTEDAARQTSEIFSKAGIPGVKVEVSKDYGENKSFYVIWNQAALDRIALLKANEKPLQSALETTQEEQEAPPLGSIEFVDDLNTVISLFEKANVSTIVHEGFHFYRRHMMNEENGFTPDELKRFGEWAGAKNGVWTVAAEEKAARGFEKYLRDGSAPTSELKKLFEKIAKWMREVYQTLQGSEIDIDIPDNIRRVFDRIFTLEAERMKASKTGTTKGPTVLKQEGQPAVRGENQLFRKQKADLEVYQKAVQGKLRETFTAAMQSLRTAPEGARIFYPGVPQSTRMTVTSVNRRPLIAAMQDVRKLQAQVKASGRSMAEVTDAELNQWEKLLNRVEQLAGVNPITPAMDKEFAQASSNDREGSSATKLLEKAAMKAFGVSTLTVSGKPEGGINVEEMSEVADWDDERWVDDPDARAYISKALGLKESEINWTEGVEVDTTAVPGLQELEELRDWQPKELEDLPEDVVTFTRITYPTKINGKYSTKIFDYIRDYFQLSEDLEYMSSFGKRSIPVLPVKTGQPMLAKVYRGGTFVGEEFDPSRLGSFTKASSAKLAFFFAGNLATSERYVDQAIFNASLTSRKQTEAGQEEAQSIAVRQYFVYMRNPLVFDNEGSRSKKASFTSLVQRAIKEGHDGLIIKRAYDPELDDIYVVLPQYVNQIKLADTNVSGKGGKPIPLSERFNPTTKNVLYQGEGASPNTGDTASEAFRRKQAEQRQKAALDAMNRLRNAAKEPKTATPPPAAEPSRPAAPKPATEPKASKTAEGTSRRPRQERTIEEEVAAAIDRARKGKPNPNDLPLDEQLRRSIRAFADRFARRMVEAEKTGIYNPEVTLADSATADRREEFEERLREYSDALKAGNEKLRDSIKQELEALLPERPKSKKTVAERIQQAIDRAEKAANKKAKSLTPEEEMDRSVRTFVDRFAKRMAQAKKAKTYTSDVVLPNGDVFDRQEFFQQAVQDYMDAYKAQNQGAVSMAKSRIMLAMEQVPPDIGFGIHSLRSPLSYSNVIGSYEGVMGELGAEISTAFKRFHQEVAFKRKTLGEALTDLRRLMRTEYFPAMQDRGYYGMQSVITAHIDYIQAMAKFGQDYNQLRASTSIFKNPKAYLDFAKKGNTIPGRPQSNVWPMAAALMKTFVYTTKLKYNPKSALMNYTQVALSAGPYFSPVELAKVIASSHRPAVRNRVIEGMKLVDVAVRTTGGREAELEKEQKSWWRVGDIFQGTSEQTRVIGYLLGEIMADRAAEGKFPPSKPQREEIIRDWIEKIEFDNSPWNVAPLFRENGLKGALLQFKPFVQKNMERLLADMARNPRYYIPYESENFAGKAIEKVLPPQLRKYAKLLGYQVGIGGIGSMLTAVPGLKPLAGYLIYSGLVAAFKAMGDDDEVAEKAAEVVYYGAPALVGTDLSNSVGYLEVPQGKTIYEQLVNQFLGPTVSTVANTYTQVKELQEERAKPEPLGRPGEKDEKVTRRAWDVAKAITPVARTAETALTMARGKQPEMYLDRPIPLTRGEKAGRLLAFNPLRQAKFFEEKGAADWQKRLAGKVPENLEIKRKTGESDENYSRRQAKYEKWKATYTPRMLQSSDFRRLKPEDKDAVLDNLKRNMVEETNSAVPDTDKFDADVIIGRRRKRRERIEDRD